MATNTSILGLTKPTYAEDQDVTVLNGNFDLIDAEAGRTRANFAGTYSASSAYAVGDYCIYTGNLYRCTTAISSSGEAWNASHWSQVSAGDELASANQAIARQTTVQDDRVASDANNAKEGGTWYLIPSSSNKPDATGYFTLFVVKRNANNVTQTAIDINSAMTYVRSFHDGTTWTAWRELVLKSDIAQKTIAIDQNTNAYGEIVTNILVSNIHSIVSSRVVTQSNDLTHCTYNTSSDGKLMICLLHRTTSAPLANTQVSGTIIYT